MPEDSATTDEEGRFPAFDARPEPREIGLPPGHCASPATVTPGGGEPTIVVHGLARVEGREIEIGRDGTRTLRAVAGTCAWSCALSRAERGAFLASFDPAPGEVRTDFEIAIPYK